MIRRGDVVIVAFPYVSGNRGKNRPDLVVPCDRDNQRLSNTIVAMITGNTAHARTEPTQPLVDPATAEGRLSGLSIPSAVKCGNLYTIAQSDILKTFGSFPPVLLTQVSACLRAALDLP